MTGNIQFVSEAITSQCMGSCVTQFAAQVSNKMFLSHTRYAVLCRHKIWSQSTILSKSSCCLARH